MGGRDLAGAGGELSFLQGLWWPVMALEMGVHRGEHGIIRTQIVGTFDFSNAINNLCRSITLDFFFFLIQLKEYGLFQYTEKLPQPSPPHPPQLLPQHTLITLRA